MAFILSLGTVKQGRSQFPVSPACPEGGEARCASPGSEQDVASPRRTHRGQGGQGQEEGVRWLRGERRVLPALLEGGSGGREGVKKRRNSMKKLREARGRQAGARKGRGPACSKVRERDALVREVETLGEVRSCRLCGPDP